jgi:hypothetical protein
MARYWVSALALAGMAMAAPAASKPQPLASAPPPKIFTDVLQCRSITDSAARLACFDRSVGTLATAQASKNLYVADKDAIVEARRGLFGFSLPKMRIFGDDDMGKDVNSIESTLAGVGQGQKGFIFILKDGARWAQTDGVYLDKPKIGATIRIKRGAMGSYFGSIGSSPGVRVERLNN